MTDACPKCGEAHTRCTGHNRAGAPCGNYPLPNQVVCRLHGGASPVALEHARRRAAEERARVALAQRWADGAEQAVADPLTELARIADEAVAFKDYLRDQVTSLNGVLTYWQEKDYLDGEGGVEWTKAAEDIRAVVAAYERALDRCARILANIVKLDLAGRLLEVNQAKANSIADAVRSGLGQVDMPAEIRRAAQSAIADALADLSRPAPLKELA